MTKSHPTPPKDSAISAEEWKATIEYWCKRATINLSPLPPEKKR